MTYITQSGDAPCYSCGKNCINVEFCNDGGGYGYNDDYSASANGVNLSRNIRVKIIANPSYWGFSGTLIEGWATYSNGYYDFFDNHAEKYSYDNFCYGTDGETITRFGVVPNVNRSDVRYRSVYDPESRIVKDYNGTTLLSASGGLGGAEVYLVDRGGSASDGDGCESSNPTNSFRKNPAAFGFGNKIHFYSRIYKNITGAWRLTSLENCYDPADLGYGAGHLLECDNTPKQNIIYKDYQYQNYDPTRIRAFDQPSDYYGYQNRCLPDGSVVGKYAGRISEITRDLGGGGFITVGLHYGSDAPYLPATGLQEGMSITINNDISGVFNNQYRIFNISHQSHSTTVQLVGTSTGNTLDASIPTGIFTLDIDGSGTWIAHDTYDPQTCCSTSAYGVDNETKKLQPNYHADMRKIFNNPKNLMQSNRNAGDRYTYNIFTASGLSGVGGLIDYTYPLVSGELDFSGTPTGAGYVVLTTGNDSWLSVDDNGRYGHPVFHRQLPYYGEFYNVDRCQNLTRIKQLIDRGKRDNGTCYSKRATLEVYPDCITQYDQYEVCEIVTDRYPTNLVPRLAFVYRGCDFYDTCNFNANGLPVGGWQGGVPTGINNLKRLLAGTEIHMFLNLGTAWGGRLPGTPCPCGCGEEVPAGERAPLHIDIPSPMSFSNFPNFDLDPSGHGCSDPRWQIAKAAEEAGGTLSNTSLCDPLHTSASACNVKQPYTTYGYIMGLCGKENRDRKDVIANAFASTYQDKTYTNATPSVDIDEPMYWSFTSPSPDSGGTVWSSGTGSRSDGGGDFVQIAGSGYGWWGIADANKQVVAPYFPTTINQYKCCPADSNQSYLDFNTTGVLSLGWPTNGVPFLIELEVEEFCGGCVTKSMESTNLTLSLEGLSTEFIWNESSSDGRFGHNYCSYEDNVKVSKLDRPLVWSCESGYDKTYCAVDPSGKNAYDLLGNAYTGNTCECLGNDGITLSPVTLAGSDIVIGWKSGNGDARGLIELSGCNSPESLKFYQGASNAYLGNGYTVYAQFDLACPGMHDFLYDAQYPEAGYGSNPVTTLWGSTSSCGHRYPAVLDGGNPDLQLRTQIWVVNDLQKENFLHFTRYGLLNFDFNGGSCITASDFYSGSNVFGLCPGDNFETYGCEISGYFRGCEGDAGYGWIDPCDTPAFSVCNTCPSGERGVRDSGVICSYCLDGNEEAGLVIGYNGIIPQYGIPLEYNLNLCGCACNKKDDLIATYTIDDDFTLILDSGDHVDCATVNWIGSTTYGIGPVLSFCSGPNTQVGYRSDAIITSLDWHSWSHGVNALYSGILYELNKPKIGNADDCDSLPLENRICINEGCASDNNVSSKSCGYPIFHTGDPSVVVRKKKCHPEVAIVTKIACVDDGYDLTLSREYHEHNRIWKEVVGYTLEIPPGRICQEIVRGKYVYTNSAGVTGCIDIPYMIPTDSVTPSYVAPCSVHLSSGSFASQDFRFQDAADNGSYYWNYYNLFYGNGGVSPSNGYLVPSLAEYLNYDTNLPYFDSSCPPTGTPAKTLPAWADDALFFDEITNNKHSCIQDTAACGGDMWCNKIFFPRHYYLSGTRVAPFGAGVICTNNAERQMPNLEGYVEAGETISAARSLFAEAKNRFIDFCDDNFIQELVSDLSIDGNVITVEDYLPLLGVVHPGFRYTSDVKSCIVVTSGCTDNIPLHSNMSISGGLHSPQTYSQNAFDSMGYWLDQTNASAEDKCLFSPFKILLDVECNTNRIRRKNSNDDPTYLQGVQEWPSYACKSTQHVPPCDCTNSKCATNIQEARCELVYFMGARYTVVSGDYWVLEDDPLDVRGCSGCLPTGEKTTGKFIDYFNPDEYLFDTLMFGDQFEENDLDGLIYQNYFSCYDDPSGPCSSFTAASAPGSPGWLDTSRYVKAKCEEDTYYQIANTGYVRVWTCNANGYEVELAYDGRISGSRALFEDLCHCQDEVEIGQAICSAQYRCVGKFSENCDCALMTDGLNLFGGSDVNSSPSGVFIYNGECGCISYPPGHRDCPTNSRVKFTITE